MQDDQIMPPQVLTNDTARESPTWVVVVLATCVVATGALKLWPLVYIMAPILGVAVAVWAYVKRRDYFASRMKKQS